MTPAEDRFLGQPNSRQLGRRRYLGFVVAGLVLAAGQLLLLPRWLTPHDFGLVVIGISLTQAALQFGDLGITYSLVALRRTADERRQRRESALTVSAVIVALGSLGAAAISLILIQDGSLGLTMCVALLTGYVLQPAKLRASTEETAGNEPGAAWWHFIWQNSPKLGMLVAAALVASPLAAMIGGLVSAVALGLPTRPRPRLGGLQLAKETVAEWRAPLASLSCVFAFTWTDTYLLTAVLGLSAAAGYEVEYRWIGSVAYLVAPFSSLVIARYTTGRVQAAHVALRAAVALAAVGALLGGVVLYVWGGRIFPNLGLSLAAIAPLAVGSVISAGSSMYGQLLILFGRGDLTLRANIAAALSSIVLNITLTPHFGAPAAATSFLVSIGVAAGLQRAWAKRDEGRYLIRTGQRAASANRTHRFS